MNESTMMTREELEKKLEEIKKQNLGLLDEIRHIKEQLADLQDEPEIPDFPEFDRGESYWTMFDDFDLSDERTAFVRDATEYNMFHTEAYAQEFAEKCKRIAMLLHCKWYVDRDYVPDWKNSEEWKYLIIYNKHENEFGVVARTLSEVGYVAFSTKEAARKCADWMNAHRKEVDEDETYRRR